MPQAQRVRRPLSERWSGGHDRPRSLRMSCEMMESRKSKKVVRLEYTRSRLDHDCRRSVRARSL